MEQVDEIALARAQAAATGLRSELLHSQEVSIINRLVESHRRDKLTPQAALTGIATISELRLVQSRMRREVQMGEEVGRRVTTRRNRP